ncbi:MAG TPA: hypothetical protein VHY18_12620 [Solirubrobacteraceae bacterium]|nr:hypothetical protein [Solirubrobacteraceae bacterium]
MAASRLIADGEGETVAALWDERNRHGTLPGARGRGRRAVRDAAGAERGDKFGAAQAAIAELRARGADVIHNLVCIEDDECRRFGGRRVSSAT